MAGQTDAQTWEQRWQRTVDTTQDNHTQQLQDIALILERVSTRFDEHERRITTLEQQPERQARARREWFTMADRGVLTLIALATLLISILLDVLPHLSFH